MTLQENITALFAQTEFTAEDRAVYEDFKSALRRGEIRSAEKDASGNWNANAWVASEAYGHVVGTKLPNAWGLYDTSGNVWEWCEDWYHSSYTDAPSDGSAWVSPTGSSRVARGGGWYNTAPSERSAGRNNAADTFSGNDFGFRIAR